MALQITPALEQRLERLAQATGRSVSDLADEAFERYFARIDQLTAELREAEQEADRNGWLSTEDVFDRLNKHLLKSA